MAYEDDIDALVPDHFWTFDNNYNDTGNSPTLRNADLGQVNPLTFVTSPICEDATHALEFGNNTSRTEVADNAEMNNASNPVRSMGGWVRLGSIAKPPSTIFKEGGGVNNFAFVIGFGNNLIAQAVDQGDFDIQAFSDRPLQPGRFYHIMFVFEGSNDGNNFALFVDGVLQSVTEPDPPTPNKTTMAQHTGDNTFGDPDTALNVGGTSVSFVGTGGMRIGYWATWEVALTATQIRDTVFERGALPTHTVTNQAQLDALASTISGQCCAVRVDVVGSITLDTSIVFDDNSIDFQYTGTGTLTLRNDGGTINVTSAPFGGTINIVDVNIPITFTNLPVGAEFRVYDEDVDGIANTIGTNREGVEALGATSYVVNHDSTETGNTIYAQIIDPSNFEEQVIPVVLGTAAQTINVTLNVEENV